MATSNVRPETRARILAVIGDAAMTKRRIMYLAHPCSHSTIDNLIKAGDLVVIAREPRPKGAHRVIKGQPIICATAYAEANRAKLARAA